MGKSELGPFKTQTQKLSRGFFANARKESGIYVQRSLPKLSFLSLFVFIASTAWQANASSPSSLPQAIDTCRSAISEWERNWIRLLREQTQVLIPETARSHPKLLVDPWGPKDQETHFSPPISTIYRSDPTGDHELEDLDPAVLLPLIPAKLRLAELMGIGQNEIKWDAQTFDATITANSGRPITYPTLARLRYIFSGTFVLTAEAEMNGTITETFRAILDSRSFANVGLVSTDIAWEMKHFRLFNYSMRRMTEGNSNPWKKEGLHEDLQSHLRLVLPSSHQQQLRQAHFDQIESGLNQELDTWRITMAREALLRIQQHASNKPTPLGTALSGLEAASHELEQLLISAGHQAQHCLRDEIKRLPNRTRIISWLQTQTDSELAPPPWKASDEWTRLYRELTDHVEAHKGAIP